MGFFFVFFLLALLTVITAVVVLVVVISRANQRRRADANAPRLQSPAVVVDKRTELRGGGETSNTQTYYVTFEFPDGNRYELQLDGPQSGMLTQGDRGVLVWQGSQFVGFAREILR